ncbi:MAG: GNAT family N-acetyltransferase [Rhodocyclaceae bacterium]|nr:GNAT family N-acetyltransferase [Rhodocyclaceae bacterium]MBL0074691.1 GNAT family N-acetyltransferase [Rhodocyclaceae bacterium]MBP6109095.1 GNAT family N-acetyltransferase [Rhodocyclaceae bacterium]MBP6278818.1 GNAT family N-acetyltransferase [Rhodocyclaceae bacterium]
MSSELNHLGQPVGRPMSEWASRLLPARTAMEGRFCRLVALDPAAHVEALFAANSLDAEGRMWTYLPSGPFADITAYRQWLDKMAPSNDPLFFTIIDKSTERAVGLAAFLRIDPVMGCIEVGHLNFSPLLQRRPAATEAMFLMMQTVFALGYRRYEWKCNALNLPSRQAAMRLGFSFEGVFRQAAVIKGRNRDTAWYSMLDSEWPAMQRKFEAWLAAENFTTDGIQRKSLSEISA